MSTHRINARSNLYRFYSDTSEILRIVPQGTEITVLEENLGFDCSFNKIKINESNDQGFIKKENLDRLETTPESAPFVCSVLQPQQGSYIEPDWYSLSDKTVFYNENTNEYCVTVIVDNGYSSDRISMETFAKRKGLSTLLEYYNKIRDSETIEKLLSYFIFAEVKDFYIPFRPNIRPRMLICVKKRYFDAVEENTQETQDIDISNANFIVRIDSKKIKTIFNSVATILKVYNDDIILSNTRLQVRLGTDESSYTNTTKKVRETLSLKEKSEKVKKFYDKLYNLFSLNGFDLELPESSNKTQFIEFAINDDCNILYDISVNDGNNCNKLRLGLRAFLQIDPADNPTIIAFLKNAERISKIEKCKVTWFEFVETYVYPKIIIQNLNMNDIMDDFESRKHELANMLIQFLFSFSYDSDQTPIKTSKQVLEEELAAANFKSYDLWKTYRENYDLTPFSRNLEKNDNFFTPTNITKTLDNIEASISSQNKKSNRKKVAFDLVNKLEYRVVEEVSNIENVQYQFSTKDSFIYPATNRTKLVLLNNAQPYYNILEPNTRIVKKLAVYLTPKEELKNEIDRNEFFLIKLYQLINKVGICKMLDFVIKCVVGIVKSFTEIQFEATLTVGQIASLTSKEIQDDVIPYLPKEQQQLVYDELLLKLPCLTSASLLFILKNILPPEQYNALNLEEASYEDIASEISNLMSTSIQ